MTPESLRKKMGELLEKARAIIMLAAAESRDATEEEQAIHDGLVAEADRHERMAKALEGLNSRIATLGESAGRVGAPPTTDDRGLEIEARESATPKETPCFGVFLRSIAEFTEPNSSPHIRESAHNRLINQFRSKYNPWDEQKIKRLEAQEREVRGTSFGAAQERTHSVGTGSQGGFLLPTMFGDMINEQAAESTFVSSLALNIPMDVLVAEFPSFNATGTPATAGSAVFGGITMSWTGELQTKPDTSATFKKVRLELHECSASAKVSRLLLRTSPTSVDALLLRKFGEAVGWYEEWAFLRGTGPMMPTGILGHSSVRSTAARGSATAISLANITDTMSGAPASSFARGVFVVSQGALAALVKAAGTANTVFLPSTYAPTSAQEVRGAGLYPLSIFGRPIYVTEKLPALNTDGDFWFIDFSYYLIGRLSGGGMEIGISEHANFLTNEITYRVLNYVGGCPGIDAVMTAADGATTTSPFSMLLHQ
jgi:HK97 family phage major capsid protein